MILMKIGKSLEFGFCPILGPFQKVAIFRDILKSAKKYRRYPLI